MAGANHTTNLRIALLLVSKIFIIGIVTATGTLSAQQAVKHLNPVIEKLATGKPFIGFQTKVDGSVGATDAFNRLIAAIARLGLGTSAEKWGPSPSFRADPEEEPRMIRMASRLVETSS
jgi:hypothetical protein